MIIQEDYILVSAPTEDGQAFLRTLAMKGMPFVALTNNRADKQALEEIGVKEILMVDTRDSRPPMIPELPIGKVFLFERSFNLCCRYIHTCRSWTGKPIYVITQGHNSRLIYKGLGANYVIHSQGNDLSFLLSENQ
ncbi:hypothetical protein SAMN04487969_1288 [Paenibacillus algorifonticola]|uniref:Uncharacterized protein n=1 Tax=Paenibacillus algorifonticola TaxID=684063 RepID=A0A1I2HWK4_9BACL|nr:hypothetical protein [Paenibacillus algorifonticola]SFF34424.1 hypothetical protein SAMN04487969_1288 [Paenibacillus algorifonticola]